MQILCFGRFYDDIPGGMQRHVEQLFAALKGQVDYVHLVPSRDWSEARFTLHGVPVIRKPSLNLDGSLALSPSLIGEARRLHRQHRFDLIHLHFPDPMSHFAAMALPASIPRVITWHADVIRHRGLLRFYQPFMRRALDHASAIIVSTPRHIDSSSELSRLPDSQKLHVIPYGFDLNRFVEASDKIAVISQRFPGRRILALGRHVYYKGFDVLIRAMRDIHPDACLIIGGVGPLTDQWRELAQAAGVAERVHFVGMIDEDELPAYYQASDLFCLPAVSQAEAFGIVQVEAMASGRPVVSTALNNGVDFVNRHGESGLVVPPEDVGALAAAINRLLGDDALRERLGRQARMWALQEFSLESMGRQTLAVYRACLAH